MNVVHNHRHYKTHRKILKKLNFKPPLLLRIMVGVFKNPVVYTLCEILEQTIFRPTALLIAVIFTSIALIVVLFITNIYGYSITSFQILLPILAIGYLVGLLKEYIHFMIS